MRKYPAESGQLRKLNRGMVKSLIILKQQGSWPALHKAVYSQCAPRTTAAASPGSLLEMQNLRPHPSPTESKFAFKQHPRMICIHMKVREALPCSLEVIFSSSVADLCLQL